MEKPKRTKKKGLPPLSPKGEEGDTTAKPARRKVKKKPVDENTPPDADSTPGDQVNIERIF